MNPEKHVQLPKKRSHDRFAGQSHDKEQFTPKYPSGHAGNDKDLKYIYDILAFFTYNKFTCIERNLP